MSTRPEPADPGEFPEDALREAIKNGKCGAGWMEGARWAWARRSDYQDAANGLIAEQSERARSAEAARGAALEEKDLQIAMRQEVAGLMRILEEKTVEVAKERDAALEERDRDREYTKRWEEAAFSACAGIICTPENPTKDPCHPGLLIELRELCESRGAALASMTEERDAAWEDADTFDKACDHEYKERKRLAADLSAAQERVKELEAWKADAMATCAANTATLHAAWEERDAARGEVKHQARIIERLPSALDRVAAQQRIEASEADLAAAQERVKTLEKECHKYANDWSYLEGYLLLLALRVYPVDEVLEVIRAQRTSS